LVLEADPELGEELQSAARARGQAPETLAADLLVRGLEQEALRAQIESALAALTPRERQVVWLAARGWTNRRIAEALFVSPETVKTHVAHVLEKLRLRSKVELRVLLLDLGERRREGA
jgi:RNA polymerase sigma factor (sigma-70 family)